MTESSYKLIDITLDDSTILRWSADVDHERRVAIFDLLEDNEFEVLRATEAGYHGPYKLTLSIQEGRLLFDLVSDTDAPIVCFRLAMSPLRRTIRDYLSICDRYYDAITWASPSQIEAIDMGRRGLHNDGSLLLRERLEDKIRLDQQTARRLFTLICVLHMKG